MIEVHILIPVRANDGVVFTAEHHSAFEFELLQLFGGFSLFASPVVGKWLDGGIVYADDLRVYAVFVSSFTKGGDVGTAVTVAKAHYGQLAIAIRYLGLSEIL